MLTAERLKRLCFMVVPKLCAIIVVVSFIVVACTHSFSHPIEQYPPLIHKKGLLVIPETSPLRKIITLQTIKKQLISMPYTLPSTVTVDPANMLNVFTPAIGRITAMHKRIGDYVHANDALFTINSPDVAQAWSDFQKADAALTLNTQTWMRQKQLMREHIASVHDFEQALSDHKQALSEYKRAQVRLKQLNVTEKELKNSLLLTIRSPITGYVTQINAATGEYHNDLTSSIISVADLSSVYVIANVQEHDLAEVYVGQDVKITFSAYPQVLSSKIHYISPVLDPNTRTADVGILFKNTNGALKPNMFARVRCMSKARARIVLPITAVIQRGFDSIVFVEITPWVFESRVVHVGSEIGRNIEILDGLKPAEKVAITGGIILND